MRKKKNIKLIIVFGIIILSTASLYLGWLYLLNETNFIKGKISVKVEGELLDMSRIEMECFDTQENKYPICNKINSKGEMEYSITKEEKTFYDFYITVPTDIYDFNEDDSDIVYKLSIFQLSRENTVGDVEIDINKNDSNGWETIYEAKISSNKERGRQQETLKLDLNEKEKLHIGFGP